MAQRLWRSNPGLQTPSSGPSSHHKHWTRSQQAWTWMLASRRIHSILRINTTSQGPGPQLQASLELLKTCSSIRSAIRQLSAQLREGRGKR